jgi:CDP-glucose 4,6-dehydratase
VGEIIGDIRDKNLVKSTFDKFKPSTVIHLAAQPLVSEGYRNPIHTFETNVMGTANLLNSCFKFNSIEKILIITTDKVYKNDNLGNRFKENDPLEGKDPYSASKVGAEAVISAWQQIQNLHGGPTVISARTGNVIGGGDLGENRLLPDVIRSITQLDDLQIRNPKSTRPWQHVLDPIWGYLSILSRSSDKEISPAYNFGPSEPSLSVEEVLDVCQNTLNNKLSINFLKSENGGSKQIKNKKESDKLELDSGLSNSELGWEPVWSQSDSVKRTIKWWESVNDAHKTPLEACIFDIQEFLNLQARF